MVDYATYSQTVFRHNVLSTLVNTVTNVNSDLLFFAKAEIDDRLSVAYDTPFDAAHPSITNLCIDMAYWIYLRMSDPEKANEILEPINAKFERLIAGEEYIVTGSGTMIKPDNADNVIWSTSQDYDNTFSMLDSESKYTHIDSNMLQDEINKRS